MKKPDWKIWIKDKKETEIWLKRYFKKEILKKSVDDSSLYLRRAEHNLSFAGWLIEKHNKEIPEIFGKENFYDWVINIYYYAIYHASLALISREKYESKSHLATLSFLIYYHYHLQNSLNKRDIDLIVSSLNKEDIETLGFSKELREKASYNVHESFERELVINTRKQAIDFINKIKSILEEYKLRNKKRGK